jgi:hypothetical protein
MEIPLGYILVEDLLRISERDSHPKSTSMLRKWHLRRMIPQAIRLGYKSKIPKLYIPLGGRVMEGWEGFLETIWQETSPIRSYAELLLFAKK